MHELSNDKVMRELSKEEMKAVSGGGNAYGKDGLAPANGVRGNSDDGKGPGVGNGMRGPDAPPPVGP